MDNIDPIKKYLDDNAYIVKKNLEAGLKIDDVVKMAAASMGSLAKKVGTPLGSLILQLESPKGGGYKSLEILNNSRGVVDDSIYSLTYSVGKFVEGKVENHMLSISLKKASKSNEAVVTNVNLIYGKEKSNDIQTLREIGSQAKEILVNFDPKDFFDELKIFFFLKDDIDALSNIDPNATEEEMKKLFEDAKYNAGIHPEFKALRDNLNLVNVEMRKQLEQQANKERIEREKKDKQQRIQEKGNRKRHALDQINKLPSRVDHLPIDIHEPRTTKHGERYFGSEEAELDDE